MPNSIRHTLGIPNRASRNRASGYNPQVKNERFPFSCSIMTRMTVKRRASVAVVLSAVKVLMKYKEMLGPDSDLVTSLSK